MRGLVFCHLPTVSPDSFLQILERKQVGSSGPSQLQLELRIC